MIAVAGCQEEQKTSSQLRTFPIDSWRALEQEGATEKVLNDMLGYLEDDLKIEPSKTGVAGFLEGSFCIL
jgi:hypothetical protein